jgi:hypothetical protein
MHGTKEALAHLFRRAHPQNGPLANTDQIRRKALQGLVGPDLEITQERERRFSQKESPYLFSWVLPALKSKT